MPEGGGICAKPTEKGAWGERGPQVNHKRAVLYSEGLLRKSQTVYKRNGGWFVFGTGVGTEGVSAPQWSHSWGQGGQSGWWR